VNPPEPVASFKVGDKVWAVSDHDQVGEIVKVRRVREGNLRIKVKMTVSDALGRPWWDEEHWHNAEYWIGVEEMTALTLMGEEED
jgi:hypothetical protein